ncbi:hypothetical protein ACEPPN_006215 [Leptodophora sp. 'Broadleaf-Isolate-01']
MMPSNHNASDSGQQLPTKYDCLNEAYELLETGILKNPLISKSLPANASSYALQIVQKGGSYTVDIALNYYNQWLAKSVGKYPEDVWQDVWKRNGQQVMRHYTPMFIMTPLFIEMMAKNSSFLFDDQHFEIREAGIAGVKIRTIKPILQWVDSLVKPGFQVSARRNGVDKGVWPDDLMSDLVT